MRIKSKKSHKKVITIVAVIVAVAFAVGLLAYVYFYPVKSDKKTEKSHRETTSESAKKSNKSTETGKNSAKPANTATTDDDTIEPVKKQDPGAQNNTRNVPVANNSLNLTLVSAYSGEINVTIAQLVSGTCTLSIAGQTKNVPIHEDPQSSGCVFDDLSATGAFTVTATTADGTATGKITGGLK